MTEGEIGILNVGAGDTKLSFDPAKPAERKRAAKVVSDMLKRGYAILVQVGKDDKGPLYRRAEAFDAKTCEYIIVGTPEEAAPPTPGKKLKFARSRLPASKTHAVAVARSAGG
jgi:hypothetical protein